MQSLLRAVQLCSSKQHRLQNLEELTCGLSLTSFWKNEIKIKSEFYASIIHMITRHQRKTTLAYMLLISWQYPKGDYFDKLYDT